MMSKLLQTPYLHSVRLHRFLAELRARELLPADISVAKIAPDLFMSSAYFEKRHAIISESVASACDPDPRLATFKALVELIERRAFEEAQNRGLAIAASERSDGCAAYPSLLFPRWMARREARTRALGEAFERFVWAAWWDEPDCAFSLEEWRPTTKPTQTFLSALEEIQDLERVFCIRPMTGGAHDLSLAILVARFKGGGYASGGAAGPRAWRANTEFRAVNELYRHSLALCRMREEGHEPASFYQKRLWFFGSGAGDALIAERLRQRGTRTLLLPELLHDGEIPHSLSELVAVHRCQFREQRPFIGGALERFCI